jgi:outer membrane biosynthesis protein TonB
MSMRNMRGAFIARPRRAACAGLLMGSALGACAGSAPKTAAPVNGIPANVTLVATPIPPVESAAPAASAPEPTTSSEASAEPTAPLEPLPTPAPTPAPATPTATVARVLMADELPFFPVRLRAHDADRRRANHETTRESEAKSSRHRPYHPAPGIIVDVTDARGGIAAADLQRIARNADYWPFRECYEAALRSDQRLSGKVSLELVVTPSGSVDGATVAASTLRDEIVGACVAREARHLALPATSAQTVAKVDVSLATGDEAVTTARPFPNAESLRQALRTSWDGARQCYATGLASRPDAGGRLELRFRVHHDGEIFDVSEVGDHDVRFTDVDVTRCVLGVYRTARLPPLARASHERSFVYALHFESKADEAVAP